MSTLRLVTKNLSPTRFDWKSSDRLLLIQTVRLAFLLVVLAAILISQSSQGSFINIHLLLPSYAVLMTSFLGNGLYLLFFEKAIQTRLTAALLFAIDAAAITVFLYLSGSHHSLLLFLYLVNIACSGLVYERNGAILTALWTSFLYSILLIFGSVENPAFAISLNNLAFFSVAYLSGLLSQQIREMGGEIQARHRDLEVLQDLNELIVDNIATGLLTTDRNGEITHANRAAIGMLDTARLAGRHLKHIFPDLQQKMPELFVNKESVHRFEFSYRNSRQEKLIIEVIVSRMHGGDGSDYGHILLLQDLTQVKNLENSLRQQEKLAAVGQLAAGIAHEIRNPLASISGSIQLLAGNLSQESVEDAKLMKITLREIDRLNHLISEFLEYVKPDVSLDDPINVNVMMKEILDMCRVNNVLRKDVEQKVQLNSHKMILGNHNKLKQALLNIVINSYQAMEKTESPVLTVQSYDKDLSVVLIIRDNGIGMNEDNLRRIFEPFHTTKSGGTGLGLAVTHKILESHEARVFVDSELGQGTVFTLEFPAADNTHQDEVLMRKQA